MDRVPLIVAPTPVHPLARLSKELGVDLWIKRDDLTGLAMGGNKGRKLEYLLADILRSGADTVVSCGSLQSNFVRQLGAACSMFDIRCVAAVMALPFEDEKPAEPALKDESGNKTLDEILGIDLRILPDASWEELFEGAAQIAHQLRADGRKVYEIPVGGSTPIGAYAFFQAGEEVKSQSETPFDWIVFASSSGSTHTGLAYSFRDSKTKVLGIACDPEPGLVHDFQKLYEGLEALTGDPRPIKPGDWLLNLDFVGAGYGVPSREGNTAIELLARREGIFLDPIYSGKAFAGLLSLVEQGEISGRILFWHTGGTPALFAM